LFDSFVRYQGMMQQEFKRLQERYGFEVVNGNRSVRAISADLRGRIERILGQRLDLARPLADALPFAPAPAAEATAGG
jgi:hypothetical protein